jgi:hypothetical protein
MLVEGSDGVEEGWNGQSTVAGAHTTAGTPFSWQTPVNLCSGRVGSSRGRIVEAEVGFIAAGAGAGAGVGTRLTWRGARGAER